MPTNEILPFAEGLGALVQSQDDYDANPQRLTGFVDGPADKLQLNKVWRQAAFVAASVAQWVVNTINQSVLDNGDVNGLAALISQAIGSGPAALVETAINYVALGSESIIEVDASGGDVQITYNKSTMPVNRPVRIVKIDATGNNVTVFDGAAVVAVINTPPVGQLMAAYTIYTNGAALRVV